MDSLLNMTSEEVDSSLKDIHSLDEFKAKENAGNILHF